MGKLKSKKKLSNHVPEKTNKNISKMKWNSVFFVVLMLALSVWEVKSEAKISDLKPNEAEQNFQNIKKTMEISNSDKRKLKKVVADDQLELGSGLLDDYEEGSGLDLELEDDYDNSDLFTEQNPEEHANLIPDDKSDLYFEEEKKKNKNVKNKKK